MFKLKTTAASEYMYHVLLLTNYQNNIYPNFIMLNIDYEDRKDDWYFACTKQEMILKIITFEVMFSNSPSHKIITFEALRMIQTLKASDM